MSTSFQARVPFGRMSRKREGDGRRGMRFRRRSEARRNAGKKCGLTARVKRDVDLRRFPPIPRATKEFERLYKGRTSVERVNARLKVFWGAERFHAYVGAAMALQLAAPRREGGLGKMRLSPIAENLRKRMQAASARSP